MNLIGGWSRQENTQLQESVNSSVSSAKELSSYIQKDSIEFTGYTYEEAWQAIHIYDKANIRPYSEMKEACYSYIYELVPFIVGAVVGIVNLPNEDKFTKGKFCQAALTGAIDGKILHMAGEIAMVAIEKIVSIGAATGIWVYVDIERAHYLNKEIRLIDQRSRTIEDRDAQIKGQNELKKVMSVQRGILSGMRNSRLIKAMLKTGMLIASSCLLYSTVTNSEEDKQNAFLGLSIQTGAWALLKLKDRFFPWTHHKLQDAIDDYDTKSNSWFY